MSNKQTREKKAGESLGRENKRANHLVEKTSGRITWYRKQAGESLGRENKRANHLVEKTSGRITW